jgi:HYDIN/CFA65/VesB family protein
MNLSNTKYSLQDSDTHLEQHLQPSANKRTGWLSLDIYSGTVLPDSTEEITVSFDAAGLSEGTYTKYLVITSNDPDEAEVIVTVTLEVIEPNIFVEEDSLDFGIILTDTSKVETFAIYNIGSDTLQVLDISNNNADFVIDPVSGSIAPDDSLNVQVTFSPSVFEVITDTLSISSDDADEPIVIVILMGEGIEPSPEIDVTPALINESLNPGEISTQDLFIENTGNGSLDYSISISDSTGRSLSGSPSENEKESNFRTEWLSLDIYSGTVLPDSTEDISVSFDAAGLSEGTYTKYLIITSNDPDEPEVIITVTLEVIVPNIFVEEDSLDYGAVLTDTSKVETITIYNIGTDTLQVSDISNNNADFVIDPVTGSIAPEDSLNVQVTFSPSVFEVITDTLSISSNDPEEAIVNVILTGEGVEPPPDIGVGPILLNESLNPGDTSAQDLFIENTGNGSLDFTINISDSTGRSISESLSENEEGSKFRTEWLSLDIYTGEVPPDSTENITVYFDATELNGGDHTKYLIITSNDPDEIEIIVPVNLAVGFVPDIPQNVTFEIIGNDIQISWDPVNGANSYTVYSSDNAYTGFTEDLSGTFDGTSWSAPISAEKKFYYVTASGESGYTTTTHPPEIQNLIIKKPGN